MLRKRAGQGAEWVILGVAVVGEQAGSGNHQRSMGIGDVIIRCGKRQVIYADNGYVYNCRVAFSITITDRIGKCIADYLAICQSFELVVRII